MLYKNAVEPAALEILTVLANEEALAAFALGGGTNIALQRGHRLSVDLDFFTITPYDKSRVYKTITSLFRNTEMLFEQNQTMMFEINKIKVDFVLYPFEWLKPFEKIESLRLISLQDMIPMKLQAVSNRFSKKDFWDIDLLLNEFTLTEMLGFFKTKFPPVDTGYIIHSLTNFETAETEADPVCIIPRTWQEVKDNLREKVIEYTNSFL